VAARLSGLTTGSVPEEGAVLVTSVLMDFSLSQ
jgi:hypothetical protein